MAIPDFQACMLPLLIYAGDRKEHLMREVVNSLANQFQLTSAERTELLPSGKQAIFHNRVGWARSYLKKAGLLDSPKRGVIKISARGSDVLFKSPKYIDIKFLEQFPEFVIFKNATRSSNEELELSVTESQKRTPEAHQRIFGFQAYQQNLASALLVYK